MDNKQKTISSQTIKFSLINYVGAAIGILSTLFIYPYDKEFLGELRYIFDGAQILAAFFLFGSSQALINFYPRFKDSPEQKNSFFSSILGIVVLNSIVFSILFLLIRFIFKEQLSGYHAFDYLAYSIGIAIFLAFLDVFKKHAANHERIAIPTLLERFLPKLFLPAIFLLLFSSVISVQLGKLAYVVAYAFIFLAAFQYIIRVAKVKLNFNYKRIFKGGFKREYFEYSLFTFFSIFGSFLAFKIDGIMVPNLIENSIAMNANGTYSIGVILAATLAIPAAGLYTIYSPIITDYLAKNKLVELDVKYKEVSMLLFAVGGVLLSCIYLGIEDLFGLLPTKENLMDTIPVILILGLNMVIDMSTSFNSHILMYSKYYRFNIVAIAVLTVLNIALNIYFIRYLGMGIEGAAYATLISMTTYNAVKLIYIYLRFEIQPFTYKQFILLLVFAAVIVCFKFLLPSFGNTIIDLIIRIGGCLLVCGFVIYRLKMVPVFNDWVGERF